MKISKKLLIILICVSVVLTAITIGTAAYILTGTEKTENTFEPVFVSCYVENDFDGYTKSNVKIRNTGDIDAYIQVTYVVNWMSEDGEIYSIAPVANVDYSLDFGSEDWKLGSDGYYYYAWPISPGETTENFVDSITITSEAPDGYYFSVHFLAAAVQAKPALAVHELWNAVVKNDGELSAP